MLMERLSIANTDTIQYIADCFNNLVKEENSEINKQLPDNMKFINYCKEILANFFELNITTHELFPESQLSRKLEQQ